MWLLLLSEVISQLQIFTRNSNVTDEPDVHLYCVFSSFVFWVFLVVDTFLYDINLSEMFALYMIVRKAANPNGLLPYIF